MKGIRVVMTRIAIMRDSMFLMVTMKMRKCKPWVLVWILALYQDDALGYFGVFVGMFESQILFTIVWIASAQIDLSFLPGSTD